MKKHQDKRAGKSSSTFLENYAEEFQRWLEDQHYAPATLTEYRRCVTAFCGLAQQARLNAESLTESVVERFIKKLQDGLCQRKYTAYVVRQFTRYLIERGVIKAFAPHPDSSPHAELKHEYEQYLRNERGLSTGTIYHCWRFADRFLQFRFNGERPDFGSITPLDVSLFMQQVASARQLYRDKTPPTHLRSFFVFLFKTEKTKINLALSVPRMAQKRASTLPRYLSPEQVEKVISAVNEDTPIGRRNYAMMLLLARLGLRAIEVVAIQLDDIDWRAAELLVRGKGLLHDRVPIPADVGEAVANYIQQDRVSSSRALFVTQRAPRVPFVNAQILNTILIEAFERTGLNPPARYIGSHILRHSLATKMVRQGVALEEIGDLLRHRDRRTTMIYAKLDVEGLRSIAPAWPVAGGAK